jgi:hypothetical protein
MRLFSPIISGSVSMSAGSTLFGTASQALTSSYITGSFFTGINAALSASYASNSTSASYASGSTSASYALTASYASNAIIPNIYITTGSGTDTQVISGSLTISGSTLTARNGLQASGSIDLSGSVTIINGLTVSAGGVTEFQVTNTGTKLGNIVTDIHQVTGSLNVSGSQTNVGNVTVTGSLIASASSHTLIGGTTISGSLTFSFPSGAFASFNSASATYITFTSGTYLRGVVNAVTGNLTATTALPASIVVSASLIPATVFGATGNPLPANKTSSFSLGSIDHKWDSVWAKKANVNAGTIEFFDEVTNASLNTLKTVDALPKDPQDLTKGFWYPVNSGGSSTVVGDFNVYRVPQTFSSSNDPYPVIRKNTRTGFAYQALYNSTQMGDADAAYLSGLGVTINNFRQSLIQSLNIDLVNGNPSYGYVTRPDLYYSPLTSSGLFQTDVTFPWSPTGTNTTASLSIPTSSLNLILSGSEILVLKGNSTEDRPDLTNDIPVAFKLTSSLSNPTYYTQTTQSQWQGGNYITTFYFTSGANATATLQNLATAINTASLYLNNNNISGAFFSGYAKLAMTASYLTSSNPGNLVLRSTKSGSFANNYFAWAPSFTDGIPLFLSGGYTNTPGLVNPGVILYNDTQDTGLYKYGMGIRVIAYTDSGSKPAPYVELGDFNYINNRTRLVIDDRNNYLHLSASSIGIGISGSTINIGNVNDSTINIGTNTDETNNTRVTIGNIRNQDNNRFYGNATAADNGGVTQIVAGPNISISPTNGKGAVTITSTGGGGGGTGSLGANISSSFVSSSTWSFTHNLGNKGVIVQTFDFNWNQIIPQTLTLTDNNTVTISFPAQQSGYAIASLGGNTNTSALISTGSSNTTQTISGSLVINQNLTVLGSSSIQYVTSSQLNISTNIITVNTATPAIRFGGLAVYDSGSTGTGKTGSILWDSQNDQWIYSNPSGSSYDGAVFLVGPRNSTGLGNEASINIGYAVIGDGGHHMTSSAIYSSGSLIRLENNTQVTGSLTISAGITGSLQGTASWANNAITASYALNASGGSGTGFPFSGSATITGSLLISGSGLIVTGSTNIQSLTLQSTLTTYTSSTTSAGVNTLFTQTTSSYNSAFGKYTALSGSNARAGEFVTVWNGESITYYDNSTTDIGSTTNVVFSSSFSGANILLQASASSGWTIKMLTTYI